MVFPVIEPQKDRMSDLQRTRTVTCTPGPVNTLKLQAVS